MTVLIVVVLIVAAIIYTFATKKTTILKYEIERMYSNTFGEHMYRLMVHRRDRYWWGITQYRKELTGPSFYYIAKKWSKEYEIPMPEEKPHVSSE